MNHQSLRCVIPADQPTLVRMVILFRQVLVRGAASECAVLFSTHYMDEADAVADSIAILAAGRLAAHGSSLALKVLTFDKPLGSCNVLVNPEQPQGIQLLRQHSCS